MVSINYAFREIISKIVYYGPGLSGKTTNLQYVFKKVPSETRGELISLATDADRTLYFDFLPVNVGTIQGFATKFQLYTVPGQVYYNATRKLVLRGVDGLVFVADSQIPKMDENIESLQNLKDNLEEYGYDIRQIPMVIQYNKRDLPNIATIEELERKLNPGGLPYFEAVASTGEGVFKTLKVISKIVLDQVKAKKMEPAKIIMTQSEPEPQPRPQPKAQPQPEPEMARVPVGVAEGSRGRSKSEDTPMPFKSEVIGVEPRELSDKSSDRIGTSQVESAAISVSDTPSRAATPDMPSRAAGSDIPARVVVSDAPDDSDRDHEESGPGNDFEETTERAVIQGEPAESGTKGVDVPQEPGLTHDFADSDYQTQDGETKLWGSPVSGSKFNELSDLNLNSHLPLRKPQMAESRKVKNKGKFNLFGMFKKSKR